MAVTTSLTSAFVACGAALSAASASAASTSAASRLGLRYASSAAAGKKSLRSDDSRTTSGMRRAGTLLLNDPPPDYDLSVHRGLKLQASLLLQRLPLTYTEPKHEHQFRLFREEWERKTNNNAALSDEITYMQLPDHFLETQRQQQEREQQEQKTGDSQLSELDMLLKQQGLDLTRRRTRKQQHRGSQPVSLSYFS